GIIEDAAANQRSSEHMEIAGSYSSEFSHWSALRFGGAIFNNEGELRPRRIHRKAVGTSDGGFFHTREAANPAENLAIKLRALFDITIGVLGGIVGKGQPNPGGKYVMRVES